MSQQAYFCHDKRCVLLQQTCVVTKVSLLQQSYVCHDKYLLPQKVTTSILLSREKTCFVTTKRLSWGKKIVLVAVPANDSIIHEI